MALTTTNTHGRLFSPDALRGFDMFWILGAEEIFNALFKVTGSPFRGAISKAQPEPIPVIVTNYYFSPSK